MPCSRMYINNPTRHDSGNFPYLSPVPTILVFTVSVTHPTDHSIDRNFISCITLQLILDDDGHSAMFADNRRFHSVLTEYPNILRRRM